MKEIITIPLLHDHHAHLSGRAAYIDCVDLSDVRDKEEAISSIMKNCSDEQINVVQGWNDSYYSFSDAELEKMPPAFIWNVSGHGVVFNKKAEREAIDKFNDSIMIENMKDPDWVENNLLKVSKLMMDIEGITEDKISRTNDFLLERGIFSVDDMLMPSEETFKIFRDLGLAEKTTFWADLDTYAELDETSKENIEGIKLFTDGALGPRTAALNGSYIEGGHGVLVYEFEELRSILERIEKKKIAVHAIGDRAIDMIVDILREMEEESLGVPETRIEHAQFIGKETAEEAKSLGVTLSMQPNFSVDSEQYSDRLPKNYLRMNNPFRTLIDEVGFVPGEDLVFGSDGLPYGVEYALESALFPVYEGQKLTIGEFVDGYCLDRKDKGEIELFIDKEEESVSVKEILK
ncbi:MAG: amidohydrolase family protein [Thermoplasmatota archaeon]